MLSQHISPQRFHIHQQVVLHITQGIQGMQENREGNIKTKRERTHMGELRRVTNKAYRWGDDFFFWCPPNTPWACAAQIRRPNPKPCTIGSLGLPTPEAKIKTKKVENTQNFTPQTTSKQEERLHSLAGPS